MLFLDMCPNSLIELTNFFLLLEKLSFIILKKSFSYKTLTGGHKRFVSFITAESTFGIGKKLPRPTVNKYAVSQK